MTDEAVNKKLEDIYASLSNNNDNIDGHIAELKTLLTARGANSVEVDMTKLAQPNRQGRKMMQSYFKKRGVEVTFASAS